MQAIYSIAAILRNMIGTELAAESALKLPPIFTAVVSDVTANKVTLLWQHKKIDAILETTVTKNERLLLQLFEEKNGQQFYKVLGRSEEGQLNNNIYWHTVVLPKSEMTPYYFMVKEYRQRKNDTLSNPYLDIVFPTANLGFVGIRVLSCHNPYHCCFLVEETGYGTLLTDSASRWLDNSGDKELPIKLMPYAIIRRQDYLRSSSGINRKA